MDSFKDDLTNSVRKLVRYLRESELIELNIGAGEKRNILCNDICYIKSNLHYIEYHLNNNEIVRVRQSISEAERALFSHGFIKIHRQYLVCLNAIERLNSSTLQIFLYNGEELSISKSYRDDVVMRYRMQLRKML